MSYEPDTRWLEEKPGHWRLWRRDTGRQVWVETIHKCESGTKPLGIAWSSMNADAPKPVPIIEPVWSA